MARATALLLFASGVDAGLTVTTLQEASVAFGSAATSLNDAFFPGSLGSSVGVFETHDGGDTVDYIDNAGQAAHAAILLAAGSNDDSTIIVGGLFGAGISIDNGATWGAINETKVLTTQDIKYEKASGLFGMAGTFGGLISNGGAIATAAADENGVPTTWNTIEIGEQDDIIDPAAIRYFSAPSTDTLYATLGIWNTSEAVNPETRSHAFSSRLSVDSKGISARSSDNAPGAWAQIIKSTDGGLTWSVMYSDVESGRYPNDIHCYDETRCATLLEATGTTPLILTTTDGGETWTTFEDTSGSESLMAVRHVSESEIWAAGGGDVGRLWHTTDGGANWEALTTTVTEAAMITSIAVASDDTLYASGVLRNQLSTVLKLVVDDN